MDNNSSDHIHEMVETTISLAQKWESPSRIFQISVEACCCTMWARLGTPDQILLKPGALDERNGRSSGNIRSTRITCFRKSPTCVRRSIFPTAITKNGTVPVTTRLEGRTNPISGAHICRCRCRRCAGARPSLRAAWPKEKISEYLKEQAGKQFDPRAVEAYLEHCSWVVR